VFETLLLTIADESEEWLTSAETLGIAERRASRRETPLVEPRPRPRPSTSPTRRPSQEYVVQSSNGWHESE
jgi:hypothetical protein